MVPVAYRLNMRDPAAMFAARAFIIHDKDIVYVANAPMTEVQKVFSLINTLTSPVIQGVAVGAAVR
jgi:polysaccharide export outer membrane protein